MPGSSNACANVGKVFGWWLSLFFSDVWTILGLMSFRPRLRPHDFENCFLTSARMSVSNAAWLNQEIVAYHKIIEGGGCSDYLPPKLKTFPSDEDENLYIGSTQPTYAIKEEEDKKRLDLSLHYTARYKDLKALRLFSYQTRTTILPNHDFNIIHSEYFFTYSKWKMCSKCLSSWLCAHQGRRIARLYRFHPDPRRSFGWLEILRWHGLALKGSLIK